MISEIMSCILHRREFVTGPEDIVRDYAHPEDLASLVRFCIEKRELNDAFDVSSLHPVRKFEILEKFHSLYGLRYMIEERRDSVSITGRKANYYSMNGRIRTIGFTPCFNSMDCLIEESKVILKSI